MSKATDIQTKPTGDVVLQGSMARERHPFRAVRSRPGQIVCRDQPARETLRPSPGKPSHQASQRVKNQPLNGTRGGALVLQEIWRIKDELSAARGHDVHRLFA